jgi:hypothetical protein
LIKGKAIHPCKTVHPEDWPATRVYLEEELQKAAHTLAGTSLSLDHMFPLDGKVVAAEYEDGAIEFVGELNDPVILSWIKDGTIKHCSVDYDWGSLVRLNGDIAPKDITFQGLALLKDFLPGDPATSVEVWEALARRLKEAKELSEQVNNEKNVPPKVKEQQDLTVDDLKARVTTLTNDKTALGEKIQNLEAQATLLSTEKKVLEEKFSTLENEKTALVKMLGEGVIDPSGKPRIIDPVSKGRVVEMIEAVIPSRQVVYSHGIAGGFKHLVDEMKNLERKVMEME